MAMEFWGAEIKAGEPLKVKKEEGILLHLSQASLGEVKKGSGNDSVVLSVNIDGKKIVLGTLSSDKFPQIAYDLVFEKDFELSHNWKHGSVHVCGYRAETEEEGSEGDMFDSEEEEDEDHVPTPLAENGKAEAKADKSKASVEKAKATKPDSAAKQKVKPVKPDSDEDDSDADDDSEEDDSDDEEMLVDEEESSEEDDDEESSEEEDEATPKNAKQNKKRPSESATKTPVPEKKAKLVTPQKSGGEGKKGTAHTATPHPSKQAGKGDKGKQQTPKSGGSVKCQACSKTFNSDGALQSHTKAKHSEVK